MPTLFPAGSSGEKSCTDRDNVLNSFNPIAKGGQRSDGTQ